MKKRYGFSDKTNYHLRKYYPIIIRYDEYRRLYYGTTPPMSGELFENSSVKVHKKVLKWVKKRIKRDKI